MSRATRTLGLAALLGITSCAQVQELVNSGNAGDYLKQHGSENLQRVGENAVKGAVTGEFSKTASFSMEQEFYLGKTIAANAVARLSGRALPPEHAAARYLRDVGTVLALAAAELRTAASRPYPLKGFRFILVDTRAVNAVGMPGGFVAVTTGVLRAAGSEDELAAVLAHEIAHVQLGHAIAPVERAREQEHLTSTLLAGTDKVVHVFFGKVVTLGTDFVLDKGYGKASELEADAFAARILDAAGYEPRALQRFLSRLQGRAAEGGFFSRHPAAGDRIAALAGSHGPIALIPSASERRRLPRFEAGVRTLN